MAKKGADKIVGMVCSVCKSQNYVTLRNKVNLQVKGGTKLTLKKFCNRCKKQTLHKELAKLK